MKVKDVNISSPDEEFEISKPDDEGVSVNPTTYKESDAMPLNRGPRRKTGRHVTRNTKADFEAINEELHHRKLIWSNPNPIEIVVYLLLIPS